MICKSGEDRRWASIFRITIFYRNRGNFRVDLNFFNEFCTTENCMKTNAMQNFLPVISHNLHRNIKNFVKVRKQIWFERFWKKKYENFRKRKIHLFAGRAVKRERRKGSSRRQQPAYGAAVNEVARELLRSVRSPKRENGGRRYIKHDGMIASPVGSCLCCWQLPLSPPVPPLYCSAPHCPSLSLRPGLMHSKMWLCELYIICYQF